MKPLDTEVAQVVKMVKEKIESQKRKGIRIPRVKVIVEEGNAQFVRKLYKWLKKEGIVVGGIEVPGIPWGAIFCVLSLLLFLISGPFIGWIGAAAITGIFLFITFWCWVSVESGVGYALDARSLAQDKKERDDRIVRRNLYDICDKYFQGKSARQIAREDYNGVSIASVERGIEKGQRGGVVEIQMGIPLHAERGYKGRFWKVF